MHARVPVLDKEEARKLAEEVGIPVQMGELNVFRLMLRRPRTAKAISDLLISLLFGAELSDRLRELVILRLGWATGSDYEWTQHFTIAQEPFGLSEAECTAVRQGSSSALFGPADKAILDAVDETLDTGTLSDESFASCREHLGSDEAAIDLVAAIATWRLISHLTHGLDIRLEEGVASWPPDGRGPDAG
jgi:alkylhydroperoxidase family enzyme